MNIGQLSRRTGVPIDTVRYYEKQRLLPPPTRSASGYRHYEADDVLRLNFIRRAKVLGFTLDEIRDLLALSSARDGDMAAIRAAAADKLADVERRTFDLMYRVTRTGDGAVVALAKTGMVAFDYAKNRLADLPPAFLEKMGVKGT